MGWRFVRQPNGRLARFSDVVDNFTHAHLTDDEALEICLAKGMGFPESREKIRNGKVDVPDSTFCPRKRNDGLDRYRDCLHTVYTCHGMEECRNIHRELSSPRENIHS